MAKEEKNREQQLNKLMRDMKVSKGSEVLSSNDCKSFNYAKLIIIFTPFLF
jgi:hypothetical protein